MDPVSAAASVVGIAGVGIQVVQAIQSARDAYGSYRHAPAEMEHVQAKSDMLQSIRQNPALKSDPNLAAAQSSFEIIGANFPKDLCTHSRRRRVRWAMKDKGQAIRVCSQLSDLESSSTMSLSLDQK
jgi:hypothetical protein